MVIEYKIMAALGLRNPREQLAHMPIAPGLSVVDWGCGPGRVTIPLAKRVGEDGKVLAVDVQPRALEIVRTKAARAGLGNIETVFLESYPASVPTASADLVVLLDTFHAVADRPGLLRDIARSLKQDGSLFMDPGHMDLATARGMVEDSGLFQLQQSWGRDMLFTRNAAERQTGQE
jgi:ubiquinone/menaquinone biosynthesis C-methylase UbiE